MNSDWGKSFTAFRFIEIFERLAKNTKYKECTLDIMKGQYFSLRFVL